MALIAQWNAIVSAVNDDLKEAEEADDFALCNKYTALLTTFVEMADKEEGGLVADIRALLLALEEETYQPLKKLSHMKMPEHEAPPAFKCIVEEYDRRRGEMVRELEVLHGRAIVARRKLYAFKHDGELREETPQALHVQASDAVRGVKRAYDDANAAFEEMQQKKRALGANTETLESWELFSNEVYSKTCAALIRSKGSTIVDAREVRRALKTPGPSAWVSQKDYDGLIAAMDAFKSKLKVLPLMDNAKK